MLNKYSHSYSCRNAACDISKGETQHLIELEKATLWFFFTFPPDKGLGSISTRVADGFPPLHCYVNNFILGKSTTLTQQDILAFVTWQAHEHISRRPDNTAWRFNTDECQQWSAGVGSTAVVCKCMNYGCFKGTKTTESNGEILSGSQHIFTRR